MTLQEGQRVALAADVRLGELGGGEEGSSGFLVLGAGTGGVVEGVVEHHHESDDVREYARLGSLLDSFGHEMPAESRKQLEEKVASLKPAWTAFQEQGPRVTVRVRFDSGFILDGVGEDLFGPV
ncbi:hypothetical protein [Streptomyces sp. G-G2]|uniref:hypothetical protein n=1 Tax=Streptomyces sp. G-G2 TaxID=3046201 RepID=UPI0024BA7A01|nr:hypothetical protein [Streptomyces sp. G-G2]MDJ0382311.1 hypothetical protein [Streptomyces sp. G-G2]